MAGSVRRALLVDQLVILLTFLLVINSIMIDRFVALLREADALPKGVSLCYCLKISLFSYMYCFSSLVHCITFSNA